MIVCFIQAENYLHALRLKPPNCLAIQVLEYLDKEIIIITLIIVNRTELLDRVVFVSRHGQPSSKFIYNLILFNIFNKHFSNFRFNYDLEVGLITVFELKFTKDEI